MKNNICWIKFKFYAENYITGSNIYIDGVAVHATLIRNEYDKYKYLLNPIIRKRLDVKLKKQKYICITGKSGSGKSALAQSNNKYEYIILDWYNINEKKYWHISTLTILTDRDYESRKKSVMERDNITSEYFELRERNSNNYTDLTYDFKVNFSDKEIINKIVSILQ